MLTACIGDDKDDNLIDPPINELPDNSFFDISYLNYNNNYVNPDNGDEKGFILYDSINFNLISFNQSFSRTPRFEIYYEDKFVQTIEKSPNGTVFPSYSFRKTGVYTIKVLAYPGTGTNLQGQFKLNVKAGGYPDKVVTEITDLNGNPVAEVLAGHQYKLKAKVYSEEKYLAEDNEFFTSKWSAGDQGEREIIITIPNKKEDTTISYTFNYNCLVKNHSQPEKSVLTIDVKNNYTGIIIDYGIYLNERNVALDVTEYTIDTIPGVDNLSVNFLQHVTAWHQFNNGENEEIPINYGASNEFDTLAAFIRYDDDTTFMRYRKGIYDFNTDYNNYINNNTVYQFHPKKERAELYFAYCHKENFVGGSRYVYQEIDDSRFNITLKKNAPQEIYVDYISGSEKSMDLDTKFDVYNRRDVIGDEVTVKVMVTEKVWSADIKRRQFFKLNINVDNNAKARDYTIKYDFNYIEYNNIERTFHPKTAGETYIILESFVGNISYRLKVIIENPIKEHVLLSRGRKTGEDAPNFFIGKFDILPYLVIQERYYNNTITQRTQLNENENLVYYDIFGNLAYAENFVCSDQKYDIRIVRSFEGVEDPKTNGIRLTFYVLPDFIIDIAGVNYQMSEITNFDYINKDIEYADNNNTERFRGYLPKISVQLDAIIEPRVVEEASGEIIDELKYVIEPKSSFQRNVFVLYYTINGLKRLEILTVTINIT